MDKFKKAHDDIVRNLEKLNDTERIGCAELHDIWQPGKHTAGEHYSAADQLWECFADYDNAVYPGVTPDDPSWHTFNRPLHGTTPETAQPFVHPTGAHDIYRAGEYMTLDGLWHCLMDTAYSPEEYAQAWERVVVVNE